MSACNLGVVGVTSRNFTREVARGLREQVDTNFARGAPYKIWEGKNIPNSARFLTPFEFDREYLRNGSTYRKSEKYLINDISSPIGREKLVNFGPLTKKVQTLMLTHSSGLFWEYESSAARGVGP